MGCVDSGVQIWAETQFSPLPVTGCAKTLVSDFSQQ